MWIPLSPSRKAVRTDPFKPWELRKAYEEGRNIIRLVRESAQSEFNDERGIELSYDLQSGSYISAVETPAGREQRRSYGRHLLDVFADLGEIDSLLEAGVGEGITLWHLLDQMSRVPHHAHGFDLCWSRVGCAANWMAGLVPHFKTTLVTGSLLNVPYQDNSFDVVYTSHSIEPNHGREAEILTELYRVASRYLVLLEPAYELAQPEARARMEMHGYCRALPATARKLGFKVLRHEIFAGSWTTTNPTALLVIAKDPQAPPAVPKFACPAFGTPMTRMADCFYSPQSMRAYPIIGGIPCLRSAAGIIASKLGELAARHGSE